MQLTNLLREEKGTNFFEAEDANTPSSYLLIALTDGFLCEQPDKHHIFYRKIQAMNMYMIPAFYTGGKK